jgi:hypothetical protein
VKRAVVDARVGAFVYDQRLASYAFAAKSFDAVWDSSLEGFRCPPGSGGGQLTNDFGREYGSAVTRRLVAEFDVDDTKILGRRFNRGTGERIGRSRRRSKPDNPVGAIGRTRNARVAAYDPNAVDADADNLVQEGTNQERPATPGIVGRARDAVARGLERLGDVVEGDSGEDELPSRADERAVSVDVARQKTPRTPSRVREATVRDELSVANKPVVEDSPSEAFVDAQEELSAVSDRAQRLLSDRRQSLNADDLARAAVLAVSRNTVIRPVVDFETFWDVNTRGFQDRLDEMEKLSADLNDMFKEFDFDSLSDEELETLSNSYNDIYDDLNERYDSNAMAFDLVKDDVRRGWEVAERLQQGAELRQQQLDANEQARAAAEAGWIDRADRNAQAITDQEAEDLRQVIAGTSGLDQESRRDLLIRNGVTAPSFNRQRTIEPSYPEQALLNINDEIASDDLNARLNEAIRVTDRWQMRFDAGYPLDDDQVQLAQTNLDELLEAWVRMSNSYDSVNGMSLAGELDARAIHDRIVGLWTNAMAQNATPTGIFDRLQQQELEQIRNGTSPLDAFSRNRVLTENGVTAPSFERQRSSDISSDERLLLDANDEILLNDLTQKLDEADRVTDAWQLAGELSDDRILAANDNLDDLLQYWVTATNSDDPQNGVSLAGEQRAREVFDGIVELWEKAIAPPDPLTENAKAQINADGSALTIYMDLAQQQVADDATEEAVAEFRNREKELRSFISGLVRQRKNDDDTEFYNDVISQYRNYYFRYLKKDRDSIFRDRSNMLDKFNDIRFGRAPDSYISREEFDLLKARVDNLPGQLEFLFLPDEIGGEDMDEANDHRDWRSLNWQSIRDIESYKVPSSRPDAPPLLMRPVVQIKKLSDDRREEFIDKPGELIETLDSLSSLDTIIQDETEFNRTQKDLLANIQKLNKFAEERYDGGDFESFQKATNLIKESESYLSELGIARVEYLNEQDLEGFDVIERTRQIDAAISTHLDVHNAYEQLVTIEEKAEFIINRVRDARINVLANHVVERYGQTDAPWLDADHNPQNIDDFYQMYDAARGTGDRAAEDAMWRWAQSVWGHSVEDGSIPIRTRDGSLFKTVLDRSESSVPLNFYGNIFKFNEDTQDWEKVGHFSRSIYSRPSIGGATTNNSYMYMGADAGIHTVFASEARNSGFQTVFNPHTFMWANAAGFVGTNVTPISDGTYVWARVGFRPQNDDYYRNLATAMTDKLQDYRAGIDSIILNDAQAALVEFLINKSESLRHSHLSAPGLGEYLAVLEFSEINSTMTAGERSQQMRNENFGGYAGGTFKYEGNVARDPRDLTTRARWEA